MTTIDETSPHYKFAKYWEVIGRPELEVRVEGVSTETWFKLSNMASWFETSIYRIKGDRHWKLRKEWVDSDFTLPIEFEEFEGKWTLLMNDMWRGIGWSHLYNYRKAQPKQEQTMTDKLPELIKDKKLELIDVPISTLTECLAALANGYVLESHHGFHFINNSAFVYADKRSGPHAIREVFHYQPFIAAYKLVDAPWWENIPDGGVLCFRDNEILSLVTGISDEKNAIIKKGGMTERTGIVITRYLPVTDEWLKSMMRGF